jgi:hypothetical protein
MKVRDIIEILSKYNPDSDLEVAVAGEESYLTGTLDVKIMRFYPQSNRITDNIFETPKSEDEEDSYLTLVLITE